MKIFLLLKIEITNRIDTSHGN